MRRYLKKSVVIAVLVVLLLMLVVPAAFASGGNYHRVHYGETLFSIGRHYGVNPYHIADVNNLYNPNHIYAGQVLYIPSYQYYDGCDYGCDGYYDGYHRDGYYDGYHRDDYQQGYWKDRFDDCYDCDHRKVDYGYYDGYYGHNYHRVRYGETLSSIARYYGVSPWAIAHVNHIYNLHHIYAGQRLYIPSSDYYRY